MNVTVASKKDLRQDQAKRESERDQLVARFQELKRDRAGLLACGKPEKAITALIKLVAGPAGQTPGGLELAYRQIDAEDDTLLGSLGEVVGTHPMLIRRINALRSYVASEQYRRLQTLVNRNA